MTILSFFDIGLVVLILGIGASTVAVREAFAAVIAFVVYGLLLAVAWVRLAAVDVALTEAAIGGGMTGMLLLGLVVGARGPLVALCVTYLALIGAKRGGVQEWTASRCAFVQWSSGITPRLPRP